MKKTVLLFAFVFCFGLVAQAQDDDLTLTKPTVGVKGGLNFANIGGDASGVSSRTAFHLGLFSEFWLSGTSILQAEFIYSSQGAKTDNGDNPIRYNYVNVPLIFKFYVSEGFHLDFGPQFGVLVGAEVQSNNITVDVKDELNTFDVAAGLGLGYDFGSADFSLRYNLGLTNTAEDSGDETFPNRVIQVSLGFPLQKQ